MDFSPELCRFFDREDANFKDHHRARYWRSLVTRSITDSDQEGGGAERNTSFRTCEMAAPIKRLVPNARHE